jgi:hypothetical protein
LLLFEDESSETDATRRTDDERDIEPTHPDVLETAAKSVSKAVNR